MRDPAILLVLLFAGSTSQPAHSCVCAAALPTAADFLDQSCSAYTTHQGLVHEVLRPFSGAAELQLAAAGACSSL